MRPLAKKQKTFADSETASTYFDTVFTLPVDGPDFASLIKSTATVAKPEQGALLIHTNLMGCPNCKTQMVEEKVQVFNGKEWKEVNKLDRRINIPSGIDLASVFRG